MPNPSMECQPSANRGGGAGFLPALVLCALLSSVEAQAQVVLQSGPEQVALLELYTSQGCSSCPPADRWLSALKDEPGLWTRVVPVAFHVDYWDYIGWRDPFAQPEFGQRQRRYVREGGAPAVYTPGVMLNGADWRDWRRTAFPRLRQSRVGRLTVARDGPRWRIRYQPDDARDGALHVGLALLGFDLESKVTTGENRGRSLENDFIVLELRQEPLRPEAGAFAATLPAFAARPDVPRLALAAWVESASSQAPLQAVGGWLNRSPRHAVR